MISKFIKINYKKIIAIVAGIILFGGIGYVAALNGWFGGGGSVPADTMTNGLVGYWSFDEGRGTTARDLSNNGNDGTLTNGSVWTKGKNGGALKFDGVDDYLNVASSDSLNITDAITIEAWINPSVINPGRQVISSKTLVYYFQISADGKLQVYFYGTSYCGSNGTTYCTMTSSIPLNEWTHVAVTFDGANVRLYKNGAYESFGNTGNIALNADEINSFGGELGLARDFNGVIDEIRVYNRALSIAEVRYHYNRGGPVAEWNFDEGSGQAVSDSTENNNNGTLGVSSVVSTDDPTWVSGKYGSALSFDGGDYVDAGTGKSLNLTDALTISAWIKTSTTNESVIVARGTGGANHTFEFDMNDGTANKLSFWIANGYLFQSADVVNGNISVNDNEWHHVVGLFDSSAQKMELYVDGKFDNGRYDKTTKPNSNITNNLTIGRMLGYSSFFNGIIDDVKIYNYARTLDEIQLDYNAGLATKFGPSGKTCAEDPASCVNNGLVGYWNMDEGGANTAKDSSGNGNNGTLTGGPLWTKGKKGNALKFDGKDDYVDMVGSGTSLKVGETSGSEASYTFWFKISSNPKNSAIIMGKGSSISIEPFVTINGVFNVDFRFNTLSSYYGSSGVVVTDGKWHFGTATHNSMTGVSTIYLDGAVKASSSNMDYLKNTTGSSLKIGTDITSYFFNGTIDEVRIYNRALSFEEINYLYNEKKPVGQWDMDEGAGTTAHDSSGNLDISFPGDSANQPTWTKP